MEALKLSEYTVEDILSLPEGERAELIDGVWYDMASPTPEHQGIVMAISAELRNHIKDKGGNCKVFPAPFAVYLNEDGRNYLEPDVTVICDSEKLDEKGCHGAPDLVVEVISPSTKSRDYGIKLFKYRNSGVREYWIINPETRTINVYGFSSDGNEDNEKADQFSFDKPLSSFIYPDFTMTLSEVVL